VAIAETVRTRRAEARDIPTLALLVAELGYPMSEADMADRFSYVASSSHEELFVAELGGRVVGVIGVRLLESLHMVARSGQVTIIVVDPETRRQGIGRTLITRAERWFHRRGAVHVRIVTGNDDTQEAHRFYLAIGYRTTHVIFSKVLNPMAEYPAGEDDA
jgi:ribosomal protein S18 acetylase RimI-like enzyme